MHAYPLCSLCSLCNVFECFAYKSDQRKTLTDEYLLMYSLNLLNLQAIANLSVNANVAKAVAEEGGIEILASLARSMNKLVAEEAAGGLWNLSVGEEHKVRFCI